MRNLRRRHSVWLVLATMGFAACTVFPSRPDPSRFFVLTPMAASSDAAAALDASVGVGPLTFPTYLDRPELVTRVSANEIRRATFEFWAGSLAEQFKTTLAQNLQTLVGGGPIRTFPWYAAAAPELAVEVDVRSFEPATDGQAHVAARWRIRKGADQKILAGADFDRARALAGTAPEQAAAALSEILGELSSEVAARLRALPAKRRAL